MGWLLTQCWFHRLLEGVLRDRLTVLHGEAFAAERAKTLKAARAHFDLGLAAADIEASLTSGVFDRDAKTGVAYAPKQANDAQRSRSAVTDEEIDEVGRMLAMNARLLKIEVPLPQTLF